MATSVRRKSITRDSELLYNPALLRQMKETAYRVAAYLRTDDEAVQQKLAKSFLITFILIDEKKLKLPLGILKSTMSDFDTTKDGFQDIFEQYVWFCGYTMAWNQQSIEIKNRF
jgi:hypothetical protein